MFRLIWMDLDDTLLRSDKTISPYSIDILRRCQEAGFLLGFVTARGECCSGRYMEQVRPDAVISSGGALARFRGDTLWKRDLNPEEARAVLDAALRETASGELITVDTVDAYYRNDPDLCRDWMPDWIPVRYTDYRDFADRILRLVVELGDVCAVRRIADAVDDCEYLNFLDSDCYRIAKTGATKENAVRKVGECLGIDPAEMIAFGDDYGDAGMLSLCGCGCAMENARRKVKLAADRVVGTNDEDGVAKYLERTFL